MGPLEAKGGRHQPTEAGVPESPLEPQAGGAGGLQGG